MGTNDGYHSTSELQFEAELIDHLQTVGKTRQWEYVPRIKTTEQLWENFAQILYRLNQDKLASPLSATEFAQVKKEISSLATPYQAGQFLYGLGGRSQVEIDTDDGRHVFLTVFDQRHIGAGNTHYQIVNQIERPAKITGKRKRIFDTTLLINGLPIIQIEEKRDTHDIDQALEQMRQYIDEGQYSDIFSTVQILVALSPIDSRYMANTTADAFEKAFAFKWQTEANERVTSWREFARLFLSIPMAHQMSTSYMILDGTKNNQQLKVMRPYQAYATRRVLEAVRAHDFEMSSKKEAKLGYVWHTTGSGKTITSFKTAWLASREPKVDKVVFLVDRIALTGQTFDNYLAYDPDYNPHEARTSGIVQETKHTRDLARALKSAEGGIIVTSTQKLARLVGRKGFEDPGKNIVFIVDEAHRSTGGDSFAQIQKAFSSAAWVGYTGTPIFDDIDPSVIKAGLRTHDIFGPLLHSYTIKNAIADRSVLGFRVDFKNTLPKEVLERDYLRYHFQLAHPEWTDEMITAKIRRLSAEEIDDLSAPIYDMNPKHVAAVVAEIFHDWPNRSVGGQYNALLTTRVGGGGASTPMAMMYWREFRRHNEQRRGEGKPTLKVAVTFSQDTSNSESQLETNRNLFEAIDAYNEEFGTSFGMDDTAGYTADVITRLKKTADGAHLDLVIVVDQLLTGFDAPQLNTLYVDRTLRSAGLIQAYSRTNRIAGGEKDFGNVVNFRLPTLTEQYMNFALSVYADVGAASEQEKLVESGVLAKPFQLQLEETRRVVAEIAELTGDFTDIPKSEFDQQKLLRLLGHYNAGVNNLKQYVLTVSDDGTTQGFNYDDPTELAAALGLTLEQERRLTTVFANELKRHLAKKRSVDFDQIDLRMVHVKNVEVNYDYLTELIATLMNATNTQDKARQTGDEQGVAESQAVIDKTHTQIEFEAAASQSIAFIDQVHRAVMAILERAYAFNEEDYPVTTEQAKNVIVEAAQVSVDRELLEFRIRWGIVDVMTGEDLKDWLRGHSKGVDDLDSTGLLSTLLKGGTGTFTQMATEDRIRGLTPIKYRNELRDAVRDLADDMVGKL